MWHQYFSQICQWSIALGMAMLLLEWFGYSTAEKREEAMIKRAAAAKKPLDVMYPNEEWPFSSLPDRLRSWIGIVSAGSFIVFLLSGVGWLVTS